MSRECVAAEHDEILGCWRGYIMFGPAFPNLLPNIFPQPFTTTSSVVSGHLKHPPQAASFVNLQRPQQCHSPTPPETSTTSLHQVKKSLVSRHPTKITSRERTYHSEHGTGHWTSHQKIQLQISALGTG